MTRFPVLRVRAPLHGLDLQLPCSSLCSASLVTHRLGPDAAAHTSGVGTRSTAEGARTQVGSEGCRRRRPAARSQATPTSCLQGSLRATRKRPGDQDVSPKVCFPNVL